MMLFLMRKISMPASTFATSNFQLSYQENFFSFIISVAVYTCELNFSSFFFVVTSTRQRTKKKVEIFLLVRCYFCLQHKSKHKSTSCGENLRCRWFSHARISTAPTQHWTIACGTCWVIEASDAAVHAVVETLSKFPKFPLKRIFSTLGGENCWISQPFRLYLSQFPVLNR